eukprot:6185455-Lingulodinium_polyedra.AAC.1
MPSEGAVPAARHVDAELRAALFLEAVVPAVGTKDAREDPRDHCAAALAERLLVEVVSGGEAVAT